MSFLKCKCGNTVGLDNQKAGIHLCGRCKTIMELEEREEDEKRELEQLKYDLHMLKEDLEGRFFVDQIVKKTAARCVEICNLTCAELMPVKSCVNPSLSCTDCVANAIKKEFDL